MQYRQQLISLIESYAAARGMSAARASTIALNAGHTYQSLIDGKDITIGRFERAMRWFSDNWPPGADWPADVERPQPASPSTNSSEDAA